MRTARANRLALRAFGPGPRAHRAWRTLSRAADRHDEVAAAALWEVWLHDPRDDTWQDVRRWYPLPEVLAAAVDPHRLAGSRAALGAFCLRHDHVPDHDVARAVFFVLTGHHERYEALDPDGTLLAAGYRGASEATREALRHTMVELGAAHLVRVIADRPDRPLTADEADYVVARLAGEEDWDQLWRLVPTIPLTAAARAAKLFGDWRPPDAGRHLFTCLAAADPELAVAASAATVTRIEVQYPWQFSFAPDGAELAIRHAVGTTVHDTRTGHLLATHPDREQLNVLALGNGVIVHEGGTRNRWAIVRCSPERAPDRGLHHMGGSTVGRTPDGFVVCHGRNLWYGKASGAYWSTHVRGPIVGDVGMLAADPESGRLLMRAGEPDADAELVLLDADRTILARGQHQGHHDDGAFCGQDRLLLWWWGEGSAIESWRWDGTTLVRTATTDLDDVYLAPVPLPASNLVAVRPRLGPLVWLDVETLTEADAPLGFPVLDARRLAFSLDGTLAAVGPDEGTEVYDLELCRLVALLGGPLSELTIADLKPVAAQAKREHTEPVASVLELLRAGLEYRFGTDVALGAGVAGGTDDIALGGG